MGIISCASGSSCWRGLDYYKNNKVIKLNIINNFEFSAIIDGTKKYDVYLNIEHPRKSKCNCPLANGKIIICKHIVATYFKAIPGSAIEFENEQKILEEEYEKYQNKEYENAIKYINNMSKKELVEELIYIFDYAPEWVYDNFIRRNDIDGK